MSERTENDPLKKVVKYARDNKAAVAAGLTVAGAGLCFMYIRSQVDSVPEEFSMMWKQVMLKRDVAKVMDAKNWTLVDFFAETVRKFPNNEAMVFVDTNQSYTYKQMDEISNQIAHYAIAHGVEKGDVVALLMDNRPEYVLTWLGLAKAGAVCALINHNLQGKALIHSLTVCNAKHFICGIEKEDSAHFAKDHVQGTWHIYGGNVSGMKCMDSELPQHPITKVDSSRRLGRSPSDHQLYIYTSGTTGNPKASIITSLRFFSVGAGFSRVFSASPSDRIYCALPLYHSAGGMCGLGMSWHSGCTFVFRSKFSKSKFWSDVRKHNATIIQYIGELCRYLLDAPVNPEDSKHKIRIAIGNGLRKDVWKAFIERFKIPNIGEFYGSTEGNIALLNYKNKIGAVGYVPPLFKKLVNIHIVKFDVEKEEPIRGPDGFCIACKPGEIGEIVGEIDNSDPTRRFVGYTQSDATDRKILRNVFKKGDLFFRSGDLLSCDKNGYYYFVDRIGDTFRWKGENVSTGEVQLAISDLPGVKEVNVYGVSVPGHDGRAGMASLVADSDFSLEKLYEQVCRELPSYARPIFIRIRPEIEVTSTFKHMKYNLQEEGFDPHKVQDRLFMIDNDHKTYTPLTAELYQQIVTGDLQAKL